jgi:hypothetical protein
VPGRKKLVKVSGNRSTVPRLAIRGSCFFIQLRKVCRA